MNQRIFELAKQVDLIQWDVLPSGVRTPDHESVVKARKFAELLIRECIGMADEFEIEVNRSGLVDRIKEHFGVEL